MTTKSHRRKLAKSDWRVFNGWLDVGRHVRKGEKSTKRDKDGRPLFHIDQTDISQPKLMFMTDGEGHWDDDYDPYQDNTLFT